MALYCSECSREVGEQVFATAPRVDQWVLLEYAGAWGSKAIPESDLAPEIKARLNGWGDGIPFTKTLFIKQGTPGAKVRLFVALTSETQPALYRFELNHYADLLTFDLESVLRRDPRHADQLQRDPLLLVCTNGRRDVSCAKYGIPVYQACAAQTPGWTWESSHVGGHRFAATFVMLPDGLMYGRVDVDDVPNLLEAQRDRYIVIDKLRGRSCYDAPVQAAEYYLRGITGLRAINALRFVSIREEGASAWSVRFDTMENQQHEVHVRRELSTWTTYESSTDAEPKPMPQFHFVEHQQLRRRAPRCEG
jgi:hypothetical protein